MLQRSAICCAVIPSPASSRTRSTLIGDRGRPTARLVAEVAGVAIGLLSGFGVIPKVYHRGLNFRIAVQKSGGGRPYLYMKLNSDIILAYVLD